MVLNTRSAARPGAALALAYALASVVAACGPARAPQTAPAPVPGDAPVRTLPPLTTLRDHHVVPALASVVPGTGAPFTLTPAAAIVVSGGDGEGAREAARVGQALATQLRPATGFRIPVAAAGGAAPAGGIALRLDGPASLGDEGYELTVTADSVRIAAARPAGRRTAARQATLPAQVFAPAGRPGAMRAAASRPTTAAAASPSETASIAATASWRGKTNAAIR